MARALPYPQSMPQLTVQRLTATVPSAYPGIPQSSGNLVAAQPSPHANHIDVFMQQVQKTLAEQRELQAQLDLRVGDLHRVIYEEQKLRFDNLEEENRHMTRMLSHLDASFQVTSGQSAHALADLAGARAEISGLSQAVRELSTDKAGRQASNNATSSTATETQVDEVGVHVQNHVSHELNRVIEMINTLSGCFEERFKLFQAPYENLETRVRKQAVHLEQLREQVDCYTKDEVVRLQASLDEVEANIKQVEISAQGSGNYSLQQRFLALQHEVRMLKEQAWQSNTDFLSEQVEKASNKIADMQLEMGEHSGKIDLLLKKSSKISDLDADSFRRIETRVRQTEHDLTTQAMKLDDAIEKLTEAAQHGHKQKHPYEFSKIDGEVRLHPHESSRMDGEVRIGELEQLLAGLPGSARKQAAVVT